MEQQNYLEMTEVVNCIHKLSSINGDLESNEDSEFVMDLIWDNFVSKLNCGTISNEDLCATWA